MAIHISVSQAQIISDEYYSLQTMSSGPPGLAQRATAADQLDVL